MTAPKPQTAAGIDPALIVILAGVCAALHVSKLPPAITALQAALGLSLVQAGFLLSLVQLAGMTVGVAFGLVADGLGPKRSMLSGLLVLSVASLFGGWAHSVQWLMVLRAGEGFGFLLVVLPAPGLVHRLVAPDRLHTMLGIWGAYMPFGAAMALLIGPLCIAALGWRAWWWALAGVSLVMALWLARAVPSALNHRMVLVPSASRAAAAASTQPPSTLASPLPNWPTRLRQTLAARGPWLVAVTFAMYSGQWLAVIGFLPAIYAQAGVSGAATGVLTALAAAVNMLGNMASGRLLHHGMKPSTLMRIGFIAMGLGAVVAFAGDAGGGAPAWVRYAAVLVFSMVGGVIPATLFGLAVRLAPTEHSLSTTVGWVQQWSALGQFVGPPLVAWVASHMGGWHSTWWVTGASSILGLLLVRQIEQLLRR